MVVVEFLTKDIENATKMKKDRIIQGLTDIGAPSFEDNGNIVVELTPNRPDLFFLEGIKRALDSFFNSKLTSYKARKSSYVMAVEKVAQRPYVVAAVVKNIKLADNQLKYIINAQEKLHDTIGRKRKKVAIGLHDLDAMELPLVYKEVKDISFVPLDFKREMKASEIVVSHPKGKLYGNLISGGYPVIMDKKGVASMPPIINSERTRLSENTKNMFIDVTGTHRETVESALNMICCSLADLGGEVYEVKVGKGVYPNFEQRKEKLDLGFTNKLLGLKLKAKDVSQLLMKVGYETSGNSILVPPYRADIMHFVDIVEDIAIAYGFNNFEPSMPNFYTEGKTNEEFRHADEIMRGMGFTEIKTFMLTNRECVAKIGYKGEMKEVMNPQCEEFTVFRPSLVGNVLDTFFTNKTRGLPQKIYEIGYVYDRGVLKKKLIFGLMDKTLSFADIKGCLQTLFKELGIESSLKPGSSHWSDSRESGEISVNGKVVGHVGKVGNSLINNHKLEFSVYICEIEF